MPDFLGGDYADLSWFPPDTDEKGQKLGNYFKTTAAPDKTLPRIPKVVEELKGGEAKGVDTWGILGYCWGGKIANLSSQEGTPFKAGASAHPAMVDPEDAKKLAVPFALLPSQDEDKAAVEKYKGSASTKVLVEYFPDQHHGWMAAR